MNDADCWLCRVFFFFLLYKDETILNALNVKEEIWSSFVFRHYSSCCLVSQLLLLEDTVIIIYRWPCFVWIVCLAGGSPCESVECHSAHVSVAGYLFIVALHFVFPPTTSRGFVVTCVEGKCTIANNVFLGLVCNVLLQLDRFYFLRFSFCAIFIRFPSAYYMPIC